MVLTSAADFMFSLGQQDSLWLSGLQDKGDLLAGAASQGGPLGFPRPFLQGGIRTPSHSAAMRGHGKRGMKQSWKSPNQINRIKIEPGAFFRTRYQHKSATHVADTKMRASCAETRF